MSIKAKLLKGSAWSAVSQFSNQFVRIGLTMVLAYRLGPEAFGLLGMVTVITGFLGYFTEFGMIASIVQKKDVDDLDCNTVFWSSIVISILLYAAVFFGAPLIAMFYDKPELVLITRVVFIDFLIRPFGFITSALEVKKIKYDLLCISGVLSVFLSSIIAVILAFKGFGVWALVYQNLSLTTFDVIFLWIFTKWMPRFEFSFERFKGLFSFGAHITFNNLIRFFSENIDYLLVGKLLGERELGIYTLAFRLSRYPMEKIWSFFGKMLFPAFATFQDDFVRLKRNFLRVSISGGVLLVPPLLMIFFGAESIIRLLGDRWLGSVDLMVDVIMIFAGYLFVYTMCYADETILMALKKVHIVNVYKTITSLCLLVFGFIGIKAFGLTGMAWVYMAATLAHITAVKWLLCRTVGVSLAGFISNAKSLGIYAVITAAAGFGVYALRGNFDNDIVFVISLAAVVGATAFVILYLYKVITFTKPFFEIDKILINDKSS